MRDRLINDLDSADLFLRNRANSSSAPLNEYDIEEMLDIAKICDEAARTLEKAIVPPCKVGDTVYCIYGEKVIQGTVRLIRPFISKKETIFKGNIICEVDNIFFDDGSKEEIELYVVFENPYGIERVAYLTREEAEQKLKEGAE